ncbi:toxin glutamine deamidase domain-containing protein [Kitasatospora sp. NPDC048365]|uniref:toxin glutamine deamidase domain-containing protein n=1 Tax=Kitasatospora sp. NPDC048365 TaxID=3364050 RepID=UPI0037196815
MSRKLPEELAPALARTGHHWPQADEDGLRRAAAVWREFGADAEQLARRGASSAERVTAENSGPAVDAFAEHWRAFAGSGRGHLDDAHGAAETMGRAFDRAACAVDHCKAEVIAVLTELAEEIKKADAAEAKAEQQMSHAGDGLAGLVGAAVGAVKDVVAEVGEAVAVEGAKLKIAGLLHELAREMKDAVQAAAKEPAVIALERIAQADGRGLHGEKREYSAARVMSAGSAGGAAGAAAAKVARSVEVAGVRELRPAVDQDGAIKTDRHGNPILVGADGKEVRGVEGVQITVGEDGRAQVVDAEGKPVSGLAVGEDGRPLRGTDGKPLLVGGTGVLIGTGLALALSADGRPQVGADGHPVLLGADGRQVSALAADSQGRLLAGVDGTAVTVGQDGHATGPDGRTVVFDQHGRPVPLGGPGDHGGLQVNIGGQPVLGVDQHGVQIGADTPGDGPAPHGKHGGPQVVIGPDGPDGRGGITVQAAGMSAGVQTPADGGIWPNGGGNDQGNGGQGNGHGRGSSTYTGHANGGYTGGYQAPAAAFDPDDGWTPPPVHHGPAAVHTDSVAVAPAPGAPVSTGDIWSGGGGHRAAEPSFGGGASGGGHASAGSGNFQLGPVGGGSPLGGGSVASGGMLGGPVGAGPVAGAPVAGGGPVGAGPVAGAAPGGAAPAAGTGGTPVQTGPVAGTPGAAGAPGAAGSAGAGAQQGGAAVIGVGQHTTQQAPGAGPRPPAGGPAQPGGGAIGQYTPANPVRFDPVTDTDRRRGPDGGPLSALPVHPGQVAAAWLVWQTYRTAPPAPPAEPGTPRTIADSRPYGLPGGLGPVDPAHQADAVRRTPLPAPDPRAGDWIEALNGGGPREAGRANNSVDVALSGVDTVGGYPTCAAPRLPDGPAGERGGRDRAERELGALFLDLGDGDGGYRQVAGALRAAGSGSRAVLLTLDGFGRSHTWNAVNHQGEITWLDHLTGYRSDRPLYPADNGLWAIAVAADNRPLDLAEPLPATTAVPAEPAQPVATTPAEPRSGAAAPAAAEPQPPVRPAEPVDTVAAPATAGAATQPADRPVEPVPVAPPQPAQAGPVDAVAVPAAPAVPAQPPVGPAEPVAVAVPAEPSGRPAEPVPAAPRSRLTVHRTAGSSKR